VDDLTTPKYTHRSDSRVLLEPKSDIKKRIGRSPDFGDALALAVAGQTGTARWPIVALERYAGGRDDRGDVNPGQRRSRSRDPYGIGFDHREFRRDMERLSRM
jgi:hypothetical protein